MVAQQAALTASDRGPIMNVVAWVSLLAACLATFIKVGIKFARIHNIELDDVYILSAIVGVVPSPPITLVTQSPI